MASTAVTVGLKAVIGETAPIGPRRIASVVTPNVTETDRRARRWAATRLLLGVGAEGKACR